MHTAVIFNCLPAFEVLLQNPNLDLTIKDYYGWNPISLAIRMGRSELINYIFNHASNEFLSQRQVDVLEELCEIDE